jgi:serine/threonine protein kinase/tetratricopeptide (TPR) repeat protein
VTLDSANPGSSDTRTRYDLLRSLGEGATGVVYLALDRETGEEVALKKLFRVDQRSVLRFKREFRSLADLHHPNLVKLYDLQHASDAWFLTMEFVDGTDLRRGLILAHDAGVTQDDTDTSGQGATPDRHKISAVLHAFHQLASGVRAIHQAGMLHRDLKPSNVMITKTGRVVVLDFGLVRELGVANDVTLENTIAGTPAYMPPEQALGRELTEASDWYAFGVMLYEALSGVLPFEGTSTIDLIRRKLTLDAPQIYPDAAPRPVAELCMALLRREPDQRPGADEILVVLSDLTSGGSPERSPTGERWTQTETIAAPARPPLVGRAAELAQLTAALASTDENRSVVVHVRGPSGSGKSSLIEHFLEQAQAKRSDDVGELLALRSRCYERETMPFKALDGVVDALASHLARLNDFEVAQALPAEVGPLTQVFPVFERVQAVQRLLSDRNKSRGDAARVRRRAEQALRELITNVARRRTLILWIDDLQWGDLDSTSVIQDWLIRPADVPVLLVLSYRSEEIATSSCLSTLMAATADAPGVVPSRELNLSPLRDTDVETLCLQRLGSKTGQSEVVARIVRESQGDPFLALQLTALAQAKSDHGDVDLDALSVEELVVRTSALLPTAARSLLRVLAIAGRPIVPQLALAAAEIERDGRSHIHALQGLRLVRTRHVGGMRLLEVYHDRVREAVQASLTEAQRTLVHDRLLRAVEASGQSDPGWIHDLAMGAGQRVLALRYGILAAEIASTSLAFERAADLYARCVTLTEARSELAKLWSKLGSVLTRCRRGVQAAEAFLKASEYVSDNERVPLLQLAASHLLRTGRFDEGERLVLRVLETLQIDVPTTVAGLYAQIGWERARLAVYSATAKPRDGNLMPPDALRHAELYGVLAIETQNHEPLRSVLFQTRAIRLAYQYAEPATIARALCLTSTLSCLSGTIAAAARAQVQLAEAEKLCQNLADQSLKVELLSARALCAMLAGRFADSIEHSYAAEEIYETRSAGGDQGDYYYLFAVRTVRIGALQNLGRHIAAAAELRESLALARATDNRAAILQMTLARTAMEQVIERCSSSRARLDRERAELPRATVGPLHVLHMAAVLRAACMNGEHDWALGVIEAFWETYLKSPVRYSAYFSYLLRASRSRLLLNRFVAGDKRGDPAQLVREDLRWLSTKAPEPFQAPSRSRIAARLAFLRGDRAAAAENFRRSAEEHRSIGLLDEAAREQYALGYVLDDGDGALLQVAALSALRELGTLEPAQDLRGYYPEFFS